MGHSKTTGRSVKKGKTVKRLVAITAALGLHVKKRHLTAMRDQDAPGFKRLVKASRLFTDRVTSRTPLNALYHLPRKARPLPISLAEELGVMPPVLAAEVATGDENALRARLHDPEEGLTVPQLLYRVCQESPPIEKGAADAPLAQWYWRVDSRKHSLAPLDRAQLERLADVRLLVLRKPSHSDEKNRKRIVAQRATIRRRIKALRKAPPSDDSDEEVVMAGSDSEDVLDPQPIIMGKRVREPLLIFDVECANDDSGDACYSDDGDTESESE